MVRTQPSKPQHNHEEYARKSTNIMDGVVKSNAQKSRYTAKVTVERKPPTSYMPCPFHFHSPWKPNTNEG